MRCWEYINNNESTFFQLLSAEGDTFTYQSNSSDTFYGDIPAHSSRDGSIVFQIPKAAASNLRLLYRPEVVKESDRAEIYTKAYSHDTLDNCPLAAKYTTLVYEIDRYLFMKSIDISVTK